MYLNIHTDTLREDCFVFAEWLASSANQLLVSENGHQYANLLCWYM